MANILNNHNGIGIYMVGEGCCVSHHPETAGSITEISVVKSDLVMLNNPIY